MTIKKHVWPVLFLAAALFTTAPALASDPTLIKSYDDWNVYTFDDGGNKVCFMSSQPKKSAGKYKKRDEVFLFITHWMADKTKNVVSFTAGYTLKKSSKVTVSVDGKAFSMFTQNEMAWANDQSTDDAITAAIQKGSTLVVKGVSTRGTATTDTFSLKGSGAAFDAISQECGM